MTCVDPTPGTVTDPTGSVGGVSASDLVDCFAKHDPEGYEVQWQYWVELSNFAGVGARFRANQTKKNEHWLVLIFIGGHESDPTNTNPVPHIPGTFTIGTPTYTEGGPGQIPNTVYTVSVNFIWHSATCKQSSTNTTGWAGTVTLTRADEDALEGSYDLTRGTDHLTGTFAAPRLPMDGCPPRPSRVTCVA